MGRAAWSRRSPRTASCSADPGTDFTDLRAAHDEADHLNLSDHSRVSRSMLAGPRRGPGEAVRPVVYLRWRQRLGRSSDVAAVPTDPLTQGPLRQTSRGSMSVSEGELATSAHSGH
jgi:hypothetical protein